jgi:hypothetical protein
MGERNGDTGTGQVGQRTPTKRRGILIAAGAALAGIAAKQMSEPVAASYNLQAESSNDTVAGTSIIWRGVSISSGAVFAAADTGGPAAQPYSAMVAGISTNSKSTMGVYGEADGSNDSRGVSGFSDRGNGVYGASNQGYAVYATSGGVGLLSISTSTTSEAIRTQNQGGSPSIPGGIGISADSVYGLGSQFSGGLAPLRLVPAASGTGAPSKGAHKLGELYVDSAGSLFYCTVAGSPGTWVNLSSPSSGGGGVSGITAPGGTATGAVTLAAGANVTLAESANTITISAAGGSGGSAANLPVFVALPTPERFVDTRAALGGVQGPVPANTTHAYQMTGRNGQSGNAALRIPDTATAIVGNLTVVGAAGIPLGSYVTLWPGGSQPMVSNINYGPSNVTGAVANSFVVALSAVGGHGQVSVYNLSACDYLLDVTGYYTTAGSAGLASATNKP